MNYRIFTRTEISFNDKIIGLAMIAIAICMSWYSFTIFAEPLNYLALIPAGFFATIGWNIAFQKSMIKAW